jgi:hypothetical protein
MHAVAHEVNDLSCGRARRGSPPPAGRGTNGTRRRGARDPGKR